MVDNKKFWKTADDYLDDPEADGVFVEIDLDSGHVKEMDLENCSFLTIDDDGFKRFDMDKARYERYSE